MYAIRSYYADYIASNHIEKIIEMLKKNHDYLIIDTRASFDEITRITSYNVCYTKLLREDIVMKKVLFRLLVFLVAVNLILPLNMISAKEQSLYASMPGFKINLNGIQIDNDFRKYPFLVYKGITYFPMTWYDCRLLGLENEWSSEEGLKVYQSKVTSSYVADTVKAKNSEKRKITIPNMKIQVNGKPVDNSKEEYPLFLYNNITYFPMTWRFAYDEFSWEYSWDNKEGLTIVSSNP